MDLQASITNVGNFDFPKAFDRNNQDIIEVKLTKFGFHESNIKRLHRSHLNGRKKNVKFKNYISKRIPSGVPQQGHLGPLLFLFYFAGLDPDEN